MNPAPLLTLALTHAQPHNPPPTAPLSSPPLVPEDIAQAASSAAGQAIGLLEALPFEAHATMIVALIAGLTLWFAGAKLIKPTFAVLGLATGGLIGLVLPPLLGVEEISGVGAWLIGLAAGALIGLVVALVVLKIAVTLAAGLAFAIAGFMGGLVYVQYAPADPSSLTARDPISSPAPDNAGRVPFDPSGSSGPSGPTEPTPPTGIFRLPGTDRIVIRTLIPTPSRTPGGEPQTGGDSQPDFAPIEERVLAAAARVRIVLAEAWSFTRERWTSLDPRQRVVIMATTSGALALGLLAGLAMPNRSAAFVTALLGSAVWLIAAAWLIEGVPVLAPARGLVQARGPTVWASVWGVTTALGLAIQTLGPGRRRGRRHRDED